MTDKNRKAHWESVYSAKGENEVSCPGKPALSLELMTLAGSAQGSAIIDVSGGASRLIDALVEQGFMDATVLDLSAAALASARERIGSNPIRSRGSPPT